MTAVLSPPTATLPEAGARPSGGLRRVLRSRRFRTTGLVLLLIALLVPVFRWNALGTADQAQFDGWQLDSQALVTAKIESTTPQARAEGIDALGLLYATPDMAAPSSTLDYLAQGAQPTTTGYNPYQSQIGLPGYLFTGLYHLGLTTTSSLQIVSCALLAAVLLLLAFLLARITRRSLGVVFLLTSVGSPWLVVAGRNLYWVPWTWFLPACAAAWFVTARGRGRLVAAAALGLAFMVKWASGYEFLTSVTLMAAAMPVLAAVFRPAGERRPRRAALDAVLICAIAAAVFLVSVVALCFLVGAGDFGYGLGTVLYDAGKRTYGGVAVNDPVLAASIAAKPLDVLATYLFGWTTNVLALGVGLPIAAVLGPKTFWLLVLGAVAVVVVRGLRRDAAWLRDLWLVVIALAVPVSWFVAAKAHSYVHPFINFVLFSLITLCALLWVIGDGLAVAMGEGLRRLGVVLEAARAGSHGRRG